MKFNEAHNIQKVVTYIRYVPNANFLSKGQFSKAPLVTFTKEERALTLFS